MAILIDRQQQARGTAAQWTTLNPILLAGEIGWESDTGKWKMGDGVNTWSALPYQLGTLATGEATLVAGTIAVTGLANATADTVVRLSYKTMGGTAGAVFINARSAGTGFTIKSTSATDTSTIVWEVLAW